MEKADTKSSSGRNLSKPPLLPSWRFFLAVLGFALTAIQYMQRINMSVAIVCMVNTTGLVDSSNNTSSSQVAEQRTCAFEQLDKSQAVEGEFNWDKSMQGMVLSSFFYGYLFTQIAGAWLAIKFGPKIVLELAILIGSVFTLLTPLSARLNYVVLIACRFIIGVAHGVVWSALNSLWPYWAPPAERSTLVSLSNAGSQIGNVITLPLGAIMCQLGFDNGWPLIFYVIGILGLVWCLLWYVFVSDSPADHRFISKRESQYILDETSDVANRGKIKTPWLKIIKSSAFIALVITHTCSNFGTYLFLTQLPTYMNEVLNFDIKSNGLLSAIPYLSFWLFTILSGIMSDALIRTGKVTRTATRKIFNTIGFLVPMSTVIGLMYVTCEKPYYGVILVTVGLAFSGLTYGSGFLVNYTDVGGRFSGVVFGISNTIGTVSGIVAPYLVGYLTPNRKQSEWRMVFMITAGVYLIGALAFIILGQGETQEWAKQSATSSVEAEQESEEKTPLK